MREREIGRHRGNALARLRRQMVQAMRDHLTGGAKPRPPVAGIGLWGAFVALSAGRGWRDGWPDAIRPADLAAWARMTGRVIPPHHAAIIMALDAVWLEWARTPERDRVVGTLTADRFDAMFG